jgi:hypothetical protein
MVGSETMSWTMAVGGWPNAMKVGSVGIQPRISRSVATSARSWAMVRESPLLRRRRATRSTRPSAAARRVLSPLITSTRLLRQAVGTDPHPLKDLLKPSKAGDFT